MGNIITPSVTDFMRAAKGKLLAEAMMIRYSSYMQQRQLYTVWLSPFCRKVQLVLEEKKLAYKPILEKIWERRQGLYALNPSGQVPVLVEENGLVLCDSYAICEYLAEIYPDSHGTALLGTAPAQRAEVRRLVCWFDVKFNQEVTRNLLYEKFFKRFYHKATPNSMAMRAGSINIHYHLEYIGYLTEQRNWLAGDYLSLADMAAAAHLSSLDYLGVVPWEQHDAAKAWYMRIKSRPAFRPLLEERVPAMAPATAYSTLDF